MKGSMVFFNGMSFKTLFFSANARNNGLITRSNSMMDLGEEYEGMEFLSIPRIIKGWERHSVSTVIVD